MYEILCIYYFVVVAVVVFETPIGVSPFSVQKVVFILKYMVAHLFSECLVFKLYACVL